MISIPTTLPFVGFLAAVAALENVRFANSPANSARLVAETAKADVWPASPTTPPQLRFAAIPLKPRDSSQNCGYFETGVLDCLLFITRDSIIITLEAFNCGNNMFTGVHYLVDSFSSSTTSTSSGLSSPSTISSDTPASTVPSESSTAPLDSNTATPAPSPQTENAPPIGAIVGGAIAGLVVIGLIITAIVWMILRNRRKASKDDENNNSNGGPAVQNQPYTYATVPATRAMSEWQSSTPAPMYEPYKRIHQSGNSGSYQYQSTTPSQLPDPTSRSGALTNNYLSNRVSEVPATNPAGTENNASELHSDHVQRT
ncbi:hypothetical protein CPAR01_06452 [Colletotrichum paranaense]|uniref:Mid2 domain-containing protein n=1 Tax=Colletotrichum paranaense TaxID=1914294 RepID=A0ABQ9SLS7_9PEZI|nr:uncharacterized protein CPAR01_06452 [Colletotrichum paranaense]KAK1540463.1 hypothetical protein CPAR01_06452 [Colletotrichum paranaense]